MLAAMFTCLLTLVVTIFYISVTNVISDDLSQLILTFDYLQVGPSTFFSSKQFEVFDVELLSVQDCQRRTIAFYSDIVCN